MFHLLQLEWKKLIRYRLFIVLMAIYIIAMPALYWSLGNMRPFQDLSGGVKSLYMFPGVWDYMGYMGNWLTFFCFGFLGVVLVTMEFNNKTLRQNIITGMSRRGFFLGKIYVMLMISLFAALYYGGLALVYGYMNTDYVMTSRVMVGLEAVPRYFLMCFGYMTFAFMLGLLIRRGGIALFSYFSYVMIGEMILRYGVHTKLFGFNDYINYYPLNAMEDLAPIPIPKQMNDLIGEASEKGYEFFLTSTEATVLTLIYIAIFLLFSFWIFKRRDL